MFAIQFSFITRGSPSCMDSAKVEEHMARINNQGIRPPSDAFLQQRGFRLSCCCSGFPGGLQLEFCPSSSARDPLILPLLLTSSSLYLGGKIKVMSSQGYHSVDLHAVQISSSSSCWSCFRMAGYQSHLPSFSAFPPKAFPSPWNSDLITKILIT